ncbi:MAG: transglycosylase SLT domain-containing protein [Candidatus Moranbacteria bacterium]|jgi:hypothetical protein|nr:transglycosylase SLT domain-containing protein [Candidatus Moranbacteria bacterium]
MIRRKILGLVFFVTIALSFVVPEVSLADGFVPCGRASGTADEMAPCTLCHIIVGGKVVMDWGLRMMMAFGLVIITAMGIWYIVSAGNPGMISQAKSGIKSTLIGVSVMLGAWLIVNTVLLLFAQETDPTKNPLVGLRSAGGFNFVCTTQSSASSGVGGGGVPGGGAGATGTLPKGCDAYQADFDAAAASTGVSAKLLRAIAAMESSCDPSKTSSAGACGFMQLLPATAGQSCQWLKDHPKESITLAANLLKSYASILGGYSATFNIGNSFTLSGSTVSVSGSPAYDTGCDDLIASYNAGPGNSIATSSGKKPAFAVSSDCPAVGGKSIPAWQCPINPGGFSETQRYVQRVQSIMK